tara:strand:+ start:4772 stop:5248 length:477 start_codon:yes stop_codon:yes gene_type:complete
VVSDIKKIKSLKFSEYLDLIGVEYLDTTNDWEVARFIANNIVCVVYRNKKGVFSFSNEKAEKVYNSWINGKRINIQDLKRRSLSQEFKQKLFERDGDKCFYSGKEMTPEEATIEHLIPLSKGGKNNIDNLVLCLEEENQKMADKALIEKINYKITNLN